MSVPPELKRLLPTIGYKKYHFVEVTATCAIINLNLPLHAKENLIAFLEKHHFILDVNDLSNETGIVLDMHLYKNLYSHKKIYNDFWRCVVGRIPRPRPTRQKYDDFWRAAKPGQITQNVIYFKITNDMFI